MRFERASTRGALVAVLAGLVIVATGPIPDSAAETATTDGWSIETVDELGTGSRISLVLDAAGNPVISYHDGNIEFDFLSELKLAHCNDPACSGGDESIEALTSGTEVGTYSSVALDRAGNPVIAFFNYIGRSLVLFHCNDADCAGGDEFVAAADPFHGAGTNTSVVLDAAGDPVIVYRQHNRVALAHCNDPNCAGGDESIEFFFTSDNPDEEPIEARPGTLALDAAGNPVFAFSRGGDVWVAHCNDPNCMGRDDSVENVAPGPGDYSERPSLALDPAGNPVFVFSRSPAGGMSPTHDVWVVHCNDPDCAGGDESVATFAGRGASLALDASGNPVIAYHDSGSGELKLAHCNDPDCAGGDEALETIDTGGSVSIESLALDAAGNPIIAYVHGEDSTFELKLARKVDVRPLFLFVLGVESEWQCDQPLPATNQKVLRRFGEIKRWQPDAQLEVFSYSDTYAACDSTSSPWVADYGAAHWPQVWPQYERGDTCSGIGGAAGHRDRFMAWFANVTSGRRDVHVLAHSMGGVVVLSALAEWEKAQAIPNNLRSITTLDSPLQGIAWQDIPDGVSPVCGADDAVAADLLPSSEVIEGINGLSRATRLYVTAIGNNEDIVVPPSSSHLPGAWLNFRIADDCSDQFAANHNCVVWDEDGTRTRRAIKRSITTPTPEDPGLRGPTRIGAQCNGAWPNVVGSPQRDRGPHSLVGSRWHDVIVGMGRADHIYGMASSDWLCGGSGRDTIFGNRGRDHIFGQRGRDTLYGNRGSDMLDGGAGIDAFFGGRGTNDTCKAEASETTVSCETVVPVP